MRIFAQLGPKYCKFSNLGIRQGNFKTELMDRARGVGNIIAFIGPTPCKPMELHMLG